MRLVVFAAVMLLGMTAAEVAPRTASRASSLPLLPMPANVRLQAGSFDARGARIAASDAGERAAANRLRELTARRGGPKLGFAANGRIQFRRSTEPGGPEAYRLVVAPAGVEITAASDSGLYYGAETLWQLIASNPSGRIPALTIRDKPAFAWRGVMLDSARHFQSVAYVEQLIDRMAMAKLNTLHWHLTDDQGWRIEIDRYPRLASIGAWRQPAGAAGVDAAGKPVRYGGYYTKSDIRAVVAFARKHQITIVPEIELPGHATAMIAAYPELSSTPSPPTVPSHDWGVLPNLLNPEDSTFTFIDRVLDEVMELFPGRFIHIGGDEAVKDQWKANPAIQAKIEALGLKDEDALQGWFTARVADYLASHGRRAIGWDEILGGGVPANAAVMSWHGVDGAVSAAKSGHDAVLAASPILYLDHIQSPSADEPPGRGEIITWRQFYDFDPLPAVLTADQRRHVVGLQANLWTEHARTTEFADRMIWPRAAIAAEIAWSNPAKDWPAFSERLAEAMARWDELGLAYDKVPLEPQAAFAQSGTKIAATLSQPGAIGTLRYSLGRVVSANSDAYREPLVLAPGTALSAQSFLGDAPLGQATHWLVGPQLLRTRTVSEMELCSSAIPLRLEDDGPTVGQRRIHWVDIMRPCWIWRGAPLNGARRILAQVGRLPFNFSIGADIDKIKFDPPATAAGELEIRLDGCDGPRIAVVPLEPATQTSGTAEISGPIAAQAGQHDLCMTFTQKSPDPFWVLDRLTLQ